MMLYHFSEAFAENQGFVPPALEGFFLGGLGAVMVVDYHTSPVGPYHELAFIPGQFAHGRKKYHSVTKMYVSSEASRDSGRANWALPKELAEFEFTQEGDVDTVRVAQNGHVFFEMAFRPGKLSFPFNSWFFKPSLAQPQNDQFFITPISSRGWAKLADIEQPKVDSRFFPDISRAHPLGTVYMSRFTLKLPRPRISE